LKKTAGFNFNVSQWWKQDQNVKTKTKIKPKL